MTESQNYQKILIYQIGNFEVRDLADFISRKIWQENPYVCNST